MISKITTHIRKKNAKSIAKYYGKQKVKSVHTGRVSSVSRNYTLDPMHSPDTRTFRGEKVTPEEIENWERNNLVKVYSHTGRRI